MKLLLGTHAHATSGEAARRQRQAAASCRELQGIDLVNLQPADRVCQLEGFETLRLLPSTGPARESRPLISDVFAHLAELASARGCPYFGFANADIQVTQAAVDRVGTGDREAYALARMDVDRAGREVGILLTGTDAFFVRTDWWRRHARRFRPYVLGLPLWDNVYTAVLLCHADAVLLNRTPLIRHERHPTAWRWRDAEADHTRLLSALDAPYFTLWCRYVAALQELRARAASAAEEIALQQTVFRWRPSWVERGHQLGRTLKARARFLASGGRARHRDAATPWPVL